MSRSLLLLTLTLVGCVQPPPLGLSPVAARGEPSGSGYVRARPGAPSTGSPAPSAPSASAAPRVAATEGRGTGYRQDPQRYREAPPVYWGPLGTDVGLVFGNDSAWVQGRTSLGAGALVDGSLYFSEDDYVVDIGLSRVGKPREDSPLSLGAGIGFYAGSLDDPLDYFSALVLNGLGSYAIPTPFPSRIFGRVSFAPDVTTFGDGDALVDVRTGLEVDLGAFATVLVGYRFLQVGVEDLPDRRLEDGLHVGVRLAF